jgi:O-antigen ligase
VRSRLTGLIHGIEMVRIKGHVLGVGPGCYSFARKAYFDYRLESHNIYGELIGELGIPGTIAWVFLIRQILMNLITSKKKLKQISMENHFLYRLATGLQVSLLVRLFISLASHGLYYFYWYVIAALSIMTLKLTERISSNPFINQEGTEAIKGPQKADNVPAESL